jgi:NTE family protein
VKTRALVLGAGGITGVAWELGVLHELQAAGVDLAAADLVVGTSAGSVVGGQLANGVDLSVLVAAQLAAAESADGAERFELDVLLAAIVTALQEARDPQEVRARIGAAALDASTVPEVEWLERMRARLPVHEWPAGPAGRRLLITAVDAETGEFVAWDGTSGVPMEHAVAASCAVPGVFPPVTVGGRRYMDGGLRTTTNVDLAEGHDVIVVLAPIPGPGLSSAGVEAEVAPLRARSRVVVVAPDEAATAAIGPNPLDAGRQTAALQAGQAQGAAVLDAVRAAWSG